MLYNEFKALYVILVGDILYQNSKKLHQTNLNPVCTRTNSKQILIVTCMETGQFIHTDQ